MLGAVDEALRARRGRLLAISVDPPDTSRSLVRELGLSFPVLADTERRVVRQYGLLHPAGAPGGTDIAIPAHFLVDREGKIRWRHVAHRIEDRPDPARVLEEIAALP